jgi:hypothetical protein
LFGFLSESGFTGLSLEYKAQLCGGQQKDAAHPTELNLEFKEFKGFACHWSTKRSFVVAIKFFLLDCFNLLF